MNLSVFTAVFQGLDSFEFAVTSTQIENGIADFNVPANILSLTDICSVRGVIFGGNDAGNSTAVGIPLPSGELRTSTNYSRRTVCIYVMYWCVPLQSVPRHLVALQSSLHQQ